MREEIKHALYMIGLGVALIAYAHANFADKSKVEKMDERIYEIWKEIVKKQ